MYRVIDVGGISTFEWTLLVLFLANFSWIALAFAAGVVGFFHLLVGRPQSPATPTQLASRTAVVMPIYNEAPSRVFGALRAIYEDVEATGLGAHFDWFFLSDTTDPDVWIAEERALLDLRRALGPEATPVQVAALYDYPTGVDGSGECVALVELGGGYNATDLSAYWGRKLAKTPPYPQFQSATAATILPAIPTVPMVR